MLHSQLISACIRLLQKGNVSTSFQIHPPFHLNNHSFMVQEEEEQSIKEDAELLALSAVQRYQMWAGKIPN